MISIFLLPLFLFFKEFRQPEGNTFVNYRVETGDMFYDSGGKDGNYLNCDAPGDRCLSISHICGAGVVSIVINKLSIFPSINGDNLIIYSGLEELYNNLKNASPVGKTITSRAPDGCLTITFMATSLNNSYGWEATFLVTTPTIIQTEPCRYTCRANAEVSLPIVYQDLVMNPTPGCNYDLTFLDAAGNMVDQGSFKPGQTFTYKAGDANINYCWGYVKILP